MNRTQLYERQRLIALAKLNRFSDLMLEKKQNEEEEEGWIDKTQGYVDYASMVAGFIPGANVIAAGVDALSAGVDLAQGQPKDAAFRAGLAVVGLLPVVGGGVKLAKAATVTTKAVSRATGVTKALETVGAPAVVNAAKTLGKDVTKSTVKGVGNLGIRQVTNAVAPHVKAATDYAKAIPPKIAQRIVPSGIQRKGSEIMQGALNIDNAITKGVLGGMDNTGAYFAKQATAVDRAVTKVIGSSEGARLAATTTLAAAAAGSAYVYSKTGEKESKSPETTPPKATAATTTPAAPPKTPPQSTEADPFASKDNYIKDLLKEKMNESFRKPPLLIALEVGVEALSNAATKAATKAAADAAADAAAKGATRTRPRFSVSPRRGTNVGTFDAAWRNPVDAAVDAAIEAEAKAEAKAAIDAAAEAEAKGAGRPRHGFPVSPRTGTPSIEQMVSPEFEAAGRGVGSAPFPPKTTTPAVSPPIGKRMPQVGDPPETTTSPRPRYPGEKQPLTPTTPNPNQEPHPRWEPKPQPVPQPVPQPKPQPVPQPKPTQVPNPHTPEFEPQPKPQPKPQPQPQPSKPAIDVRPIGELSPPKSDGVFEPTPRKPIPDVQEPEREYGYQPKPKQRYPKVKVGTTHPRSKDGEPLVTSRSIVDNDTVDKYGVGQFKLNRISRGRNAETRDLELTAYIQNSSNPKFQVEQAVAPVLTPEEEAAAEAAAAEALEAQLSGEDAAREKDNTTTTVDRFKLGIHEPQEINLDNPYTNIRTRKQYGYKISGRFGKPRTGIVSDVSEENTSDSKLFKRIKQSVGQYLKTKQGEPLNNHLKTIKSELT